jgi:hypothetical protein
MIAAMTRPPLSDILFCIILQVTTFVVPDHVQMEMAAFLGAMIVAPKFIKNEGNKLNWVVAMVFSSMSGVAIAYFFGGWYCEAQGIALGSFHSNGIACLAGMVSNPLARFLVNFSNRIVEKAPSIADKAVGFINNFFKKTE